MFDGSLGWLRWAEQPIYRLCGVDEHEDQHWTRYAAGVMLFSVVSMLLTYVVLRLQRVLPLNPQHLPAVADRQAFETSASFTTNTNWQSYGGEMVMSYFSQMTQLAFHNFGSAAVGIAAAVALVRGIARKSAGRLGNFWVDLTRCTLYLLLPVSVIVALIFVQQGVIQNFKPYLDVTTLEGAKQTIAMGPVASQEAIKQIGTNGGGFFNANAAHPFENPTPWSNFWSMITIFLIPSGLTYMLGRMVKSQRHGWAVWAAMFVLFFAGVTTAYWAEARGNPIHAARGIDLATTATNPGGNMEGKEVRFGIVNSALYATVTTDASCGAVNSMHDSFTPLGGLVPLANIQLGELVFGGVGSGLYGMLVMVVLTVFIAGLMVGRTPEYLGKKIQAREVQMAMLYVLIFPAVILTMTAVSVLAADGLKGLNNARTARPIRDLVRLHVHGRQQRQRLRRADGNDVLLQHAPGTHDPHRPLRDDGADARARRIPRREEDRPGDGRHVPGERAALRAAPRQRGADRRRPHVLPRSLSGSARRALVDGRRETVLT